ncbi:MAG: radical SAM family heme chaperone HemW [Lachnospiraceae bacterium]|nr:radical SAM family heme chaperone HemW [Lachnospiraceae bacterium]
MNHKKLGIYIHIPFCVAKCNYCDFNSFASDDKTKADYINALCSEIKVYGPQFNDYTVDTVFIGGGTPSILPAELTAKFMDCLRSNFNIDGGAEISMEANPGTLDIKKINRYRELGINRISLGLQSTVSDELKILGRIHDYKTFLDSFMMLREAGFKNINVDLMNGIPNQTFESFRESLLRIKELNPEHISIYSLIVEEGTPFYTQQLNLPDEDEERVMVHSIPSILGDEYHQYEISNYSKKGLESRHNIKYWVRDEYLGMGLSAASLINEKRIKNTDNIKDYISVFSDTNFEKNSKVKIKELTDSKEAFKDLEENYDNNIRFSEFESLTDEDRMSEYMFLGLRMNEGILIPDFEKTFGISVFKIFGDIINKHIEEGLLEKNNDRIFLTERGRDLANYVWSDFLGD